MDRMRRVVHCLNGVFQAEKSKRAGVLVTVCAFFSCHNPLSVPISTPRPPPINMITLQGRNGRAEGPRHLSKRRARPLLVAGHKLGHERLEVEDGLLPLLQAVLVKRGQRRDVGLLFLRVCVWGGGVDLVWLGGRGVLGPGGTPIEVGSKTRRNPYTPPK